LENCRGIANPIGVKVGPKSTPDNIAAVVKILNPSNEPGKICLISRLGYRDVKRLLPLHIKTIQAKHLKVLWLCDPMHGNTYISSRKGLKTRSFDHILIELIETFRCHEDNDSHLGGVHFELTGENVTECVGGPQDLSDSDLLERYTTYCDPRLNYLQSMEISFLLADMISQEQKRRQYKTPKKKVVSKPPPPSSQPPSSQPQQKQPQQKQQQQQQQQQQQSQSQKQQQEKQPQQQSQSQKEQQSQQQQKSLDSTNISSKL